MIYPTLKELLEKVESKYTLVVAVSKRARQIVDGQPKLTKTASNKPVTVAINEIAEGKLTYVRNADITDVEIEEQTGESNAQQ